MTHPRVDEQFGDHKDIRNLLSPSSDISECMPEESWHSPKQAYVTSTVKTYN